MNPFTLRPYAGADWFCDREKETKQLQGAIKNQRPVTLHSIRRLGKTGLIMHVQSKLPKKYVSVYVDILDTRTESEFANKLISATLSALEKKRNLLNKALQLFARFRASVVFDPVLGAPTISLDIKEGKEVTMSLQILWKLLKEEKKQFQIAIDEFQQIVSYPNSFISATLREAVQTIPNLHFLFSGSQKHLLTGLFSDAKKPLYKLSELMELQTIPYSSYIEFIIKQFTKHNKGITENQVHHILKWTKLHTFYVQYFCHLLFEKSPSVIEDHHIEAIKKHIFLENDTVYYQFKRLLTFPQWSLLSAIAHENILQKPTSTAIRIKYNLGASATVNRSLQSLLDKEMIYAQFDDQGRPEYQVYDVFLSRWIAQKDI